MYGLTPPVLVDWVALTVKGLPELVPSRFEKSMLSPPTVPLSPNTSLLTEPAVKWLPCVTSWKAEPYTVVIPLMWSSGETASVTIPVCRLALTPEMALEKSAGLLPARPLKVYPPLLSSAAKVEVEPTR